MKSGSVNPCQSHRPFCDDQPTSLRQRHSRDLGSSKDLSMHLAGSRGWCARWWIGCRGASRFWEITWGKLIVRATGFLITGVVSAVHNVSIVANILNKVCSSWPVSLLSTDSQMLFVQHSSLTGVTAPVRGCVFHSLYNPNISHDHHREREFW